MARRVLRVSFMSTVLLLLPAAALLSGCGEDCGPGTVERDGECVPAGTIRECAPGTRAENGTCVPDASVCGPGTILDPATNTCIAAEGARVQLVHNAADPAAATIDIYVNDVLFLDDFTYRSATPFITVAAEQALTFAVAPEDSDSAADALASFELELPMDAREILIVSGVLPRDDAEFTPNPTEPGREELNLFRIENAERSLDSEDQYLLSVFHGATDVPAFDVVTDPLGARNVVVDDLSYGESTAYVPFDVGLTLLEVVAADGTSRRIGSFQTSVETLFAAPDGIPAGNAALAVASGFDNPVANQDGAPFGVLLVLPSGTTAELDEAGRLQIVHDAAGVEIGAVDVWIDEQRVADDLPFRAATPFLTVPAAVEITVTLTADDGTLENPLVTETLTLDVKEDALLVAAGVTDPAGYVANPNGRDTELDLFLAPARERASSAMVDLAAFHGVTDAPALDVYIEPVSTTPVTGDPALTNIAYGDNEGFASRIAGAYVVTLTEAGSQQPLARFTADLSGLSGQGAMVIASGFLAPEANRNGPGLELLLATPDGETQPLGDTARLQVIHASPDPTAETVDVYVARSLVLDDLSFGSATPFLVAPADTPLVIDVAAADSGEAGDVLPQGASLFRATPQLEPGSVNIAVASGVLDPTQFDQGANGDLMGFGVRTLPSARMQAPAGETLVTVFHGVPDLGPLDVAAVPTGAVLVNNVSFGEFAAEYVTLPPAVTSVEITNADNTPIGDGLLVTLPLQTAGGEAATLVLTGFLDGAANQSGRPLQGLLVLPSGAVTESDVN